MSFKAGAIEATLGLDTKPFGTGIGKAEAVSDRFASNFKKQMNGMSANAASAANSVAASFSSKLDGLKAKFGESSLLGGGAKMFAGAGAVAGIAIAARQFANIARSVRELTEEWGELSKDTDKFVQKFSGLVPILGDVVSGVWNIGQAITGNAAKLKEQAEAWKWFHEAVKATLALQSEGVGGKTLSFRDSFQRSMDEAKLALMPEGMDKERMKIGIGARNEEVSLVRSAQEQIKALGIDKLKAEIEEQKKKGGLITFGSGKSPLVEQLEELERQAAAINEAKDRAIAAVGDAKQAKIDRLNTDAADKSFQSWAKSAETAAETINSALSDIQKEIDQFGMTDLQKQMDDVNRAAASMGPEKFQEMSDAINNLRTLRAGELVKGLEAEVSSFGKSEFDKMRDQIKNNKDLNAEETKRGLAAIDKREELFKGKEFGERVDAFKKSIESAGEIFNKQMGFLQEALAAGKITSSEFDLGAAKARKDAFGEDKLPGLVKAGSAEAFAMRLDARNRGSDNPVAIAKEQKRLQEKSLDVLKDIRKQGDPSGEYVYAGTF